MKKTKKQDKPLTIRAYVYAWQRRQPHPTTWNETEIVTYKYGLDRGYVAGYRAALRAAKKGKVKK